MTPSGLRASLFAVLFGACVWAGVFATACGYYGKPNAPDCLTVSELQSVSLDCEPLQRHEAIAHPMFAALGVTDLREWHVELAPETQWSDEHRRAYFTSPDLPGWLLWGMTDRTTHTLWLADEELFRAVLAHEECHAHWPAAAHEEWPLYGCDVIERRVSEQMTPADGVLLGGYDVVPLSLPDGSVAHGVRAPNPSR